MHVDYMSGPHDGDKCACKHDGTHWLRRCVAANANDREVSARWLADRIRRYPDTQFFPAYLAEAQSTPIDLKVKVQPTMAGPDKWHASPENYEGYKGYHPSKPNEDLR